MSQCREKALLILPDNFSVKRNGRCKILKIKATTTALRFLETMVEIQKRTTIVKNFFLYSLYTF